MHPHDIGIAVLYCFVLHFFFAPNGKFVFSVKHGDFPIKHEKKI